MDFRREPIVAATMISRMIGTSVFSDRTKFSVVTANRFPQNDFDHLRGFGSKDCMVIRGEFAGRNSFRPVAGLIEKVLLLKTACIAAQFRQRLVPLRLACLAHPPEM